MKNKKYDITQCALYKCPTKRRLAERLKMDYTQMVNLKFIDYNIYPWKEKKGRTIKEPKKELKRVQRRILDLLHPVTRPEWLISGEKGKSYIDNGKAHLKAKYALTLDIKSFYDNCTREYVYQFFKGKLKTAPDVAKILTDIVTYENKIPPGSPASQIIAYYAYADMFEEMAGVAIYHGCNTFTLYVDDTTTSSEAPFAKNKLSLDYDKILRKYGHKPSYKKSRYYSENEAKPVTGTIVTPDNRLDVPNRLQAKAYMGFMAIKNKDITQIDEIELNRLSGQVQAAQNIKSDIFPEIGRAVRRLRKEMKAEA